MGNNGKQEEREGIYLSLMLSFERRQYNNTERYWHVHGVDAAVTILCNPENQYEVINKSRKSVIERESAKTISRNGAIVAHDHIPSRIFLVLEHPHGTN